MLQDRTSGVAKSPQSGPRPCRATHPRNGDQALCPQRIVSSDLEAADNGSSATPLPRYPLYGFGPNSVFIASISRRFRAIALSRLGRTLSSLVASWMRRAGSASAFARSASLALPVICSTFCTANCGRCDHHRRVGTGLAPAHLPVQPNYSPLMKRRSRPRAPPDRWA